LIYNKLNIKEGMMNIFEKVKEIIKEDKKELEIELYSNIKNDLNLDSLDVVDRLLLIEEHFLIEISDDELIKIETIEDLVSCIKKLK